MTLENLQLHDRVTREANDNFLPKMNRLMHRVANRPTTQFSGQGERCVSRPWGLGGGQPGGRGGFSFRYDDGREQVMPIKPTTVAIPPDATIATITPGAGGYGPPGDRDGALLDEDYASGKFTAAYMKRHYGHTPRRRGARKSPTGSSKG